MLNCFTYHRKYVLSYRRSIEYTVDRSTVRNLEHKMFLITFTIRIVTLFSAYSITAVIDLILFNLYIPWRGGGGGIFASEQAFR